MKLSDKVLAQDWLDTLNNPTEEMLAPYRARAKRFIEEEHLDWPEDQLTRCIFGLCFGHGLPIDTVRKEVFEVAALDRIAKRSKTPRHSRRSR